MLRIAIVAGLLALAACGQQQAPIPSADNDTAEAPKAAAEAVPDLTGNWRVTKLDGRDISGQGLTANFAAGQTVMASGCLRRAWSYSQERNIVRFKSNPGGSSNCGGSTPGADAETAYAALERANIAIFAKKGQEATLSGTGGNLTLERS